jgi:hypothetical protein
MYQEAVERPLRGEWSSTIFVAWSREGAVGAATCYGSSVRDSAAKRSGQKAIKQEDKVLAADE